MSRGFYGKVLGAGAGVDEASVVFEEGGGVGVAHVGCCGGCIAGAFVFVGGVGVAHDVVGPGNA